LEGHIPFLTGIVPGGLRYSSGSQTEHFAVTAGFAEVSENRVSILVDAAEEVSMIDVERARKAMERARERVAKSREEKDIDFLRAEAALSRAIARVRIGEKGL